MMVTAIQASLGVVNRGGAIPEPDDQEPQDSVLAQAIADLTWFSANPSATATNEDIGVMLRHNILAMNAVVTLCKDWSRWRSGFDLGPLFAAIWNTIGMGRDVRRTETMEEGEVTAEDAKRQRAEYLEETVMEGMLEQVMGTLEEERVVAEKSKAKGKGVEARKHGRDEDEVSLGAFGRRRRERELTVFDAADRRSPQ
jgi:hypothetical protein